MAKDSLTAKLSLEASFETIQSIRRMLADETNQAELMILLCNTTATYLGGKTDGQVEIQGTLKVSQPRKTKRGPRDPIPKVEGGVLSWYDPDEDRTNVVGKVGSAKWFEWLGQEQHTSFRYISKNKATFTALRRKDGKWYASKRLDGRLKRRYLGVAQSVTVEKMDRVAFELAQREML